MTEVMTGGKARGLDVYVRPNLVLRLRDPQVICGAIRCLYELQRSYNVQQVRLARVTLGVDA